MKKFLAEFFGTMILVLLGTGTVVIAKGDVLAIGLAFGLAITISAYSFGAVSGGHFNPAVTTAMWINHKIDLPNAIGYIVSQFVGAIVGSAFVLYFVKSLGLPSTSLGQNDFPNISSLTAIIVEILITFIFVTIILLVTSDKFGNPNMAGLIIGIALAFLIIIALNLTGGSLNPARSFGPAIFAGGSALSHYWVFLVAPEIGAILAAFVARYFEN
ncbi:MIP/aquaporin family protein [Lentilactobacillus sp. SPB1-3]|uniref:MIP/aquaporin family protein n=1 Tax=Lentilactobacillus terminaliae TaxID=3003483 RepID=A0ACD5DG58_9LACO|nr:aquaporin [Lentilactobacillus sp. SPB1-3]MCZ0976792.1 aquaporin [Lentilactobacillus sp. SPB1-3]